MYDFEEGMKIYLNSNGLPNLCRMNKLVIHYPSLVSLRSGSYIETIIGVEQKIELPEMDYLHTLMVWSRIH